MYIKPGPRPGLRFDKAGAPSGQAKAGAFRPSRAGTALVTAEVLVTWVTYRDPPYVRHLRPWNDMRDKILRKSYQRIATIYHVLVITSLYTGVHWQKIIVCSGLHMSVIEWLRVRHHRTAARRSGTSGLRYSATDGPVNFINFSKKRFYPVTSRPIMMPMDRHSSVIYDICRPCNRI